MKKVSYIEMDYGELEMLIDNYIGIPYEVVSENLWDNDSSYTFYLNGEINDWERNKLDAWLNGESKNPPSTHVIMEYLLSMDALPEKGDYLIKVCW